VYFKLTELGCTKLPELVYYLTALGWTKLTQLDSSKLPELVKCMAS